MSTITATPDATNAAVLLSISKTASVAYITRTDINGVARVRVPALTLPSYGSGMLYVTDYEAAHGSVTYRVYHTGSSAVAASRTVTVTIATPWLFVPALPHLSVNVPQVSTFNSSRTSTTVTHQILNRADPAVKMGVLNLREGTMDLWCAEYATTRILDLAVASGETLMLRQAVAGMDLYFVAAGADAQPISEEGNATEWRYTIRFIETLRPEGLLKGARGWTFAEIANSFNTFAEVTAAYADFNKLLISQEK